MDMYCLLTKHFKVLATISQLLFFFVDSELIYISTQLRKTNCRLYIYHVDCSIHELQQKVVSIVLYWLLTLGWYCISIDVLLYKSATCTSIISQCYHYRLSPSGNSCSQCIRLTDSMVTLYSYKQSSVTSKLTKHVKSQRNVSNPIYL